MVIIPAIDIKDGNCVRLYKGEEGTETVFSSNPAEVAKKWESAGADWIHVVDLDGAFSGNPKNFEVIESIINSVSCSVQVGGGIRGLETVSRYIDVGVERVIIGTSAFNGSGFLQEACGNYPQKIAVGIDTKDEKIAVKGWTEVVDESVDEVITNLKSVGVSLIIHTNVDKDGTMEGIDIEPVRNFIISSPIPTVASGGIATDGDLEKLAPLVELGLYGVILGKSIYTGSIDLKKAIERFS